MIKNIFLITIFLIIYGSLYPFDFQFNEIGHAEFSEFMQTWLSVTHRGDIIANVLIFIPFGFIGAYCFPRSTSKVKVISLISLLAIFLGFGLQVLQLYLPSRDQNLFDGVLNMLGTWLGLFIAMALNISVNDKMKSFSFSLPLLLIASWFTYRLLPFVPSLDWQEIKDSVKPLLLQPQLDAVSLYHDMIAWAVVLFLIERTFKIRQPLRDMGLLLLCCLLLEVLIVNNSISLSNVLGAAAGYYLWLLVRKSAQQKTTLILASLLSVYFVIYSLTPFELSGIENSFHWIPFSGFLGDSMYTNTLAFIEKFFFYGSFVWLLLNANMRPLYVAVLSAIFMLLLEFTQTFVGNHIAEITDALLILMLVYFFTLVKREHPAAFKGTSSNSTNVQHISILLFIESANYLDQISSHGLSINRTPFYIGRISDSRSIQLPQKRSLLLADSPPYQLSRKHLKIDFKHGQLMVKDAYSTLGTLVNGISIGKEQSRKWARLNQGANIIIAGGENEGIRFRIVLSQKLQAQEKSELTASINV